MPPDAISYACLSMATPAQILANRLNAEKSTGPVTAEGRARISQNATKLEVLYKIGRPIAKHANAVTVGERSLASQARMSYLSVQENARSLARKLAIEIRAASESRR
jgi:hypothetical protein